jgi:hypothetical protein
MDETMVSYHTPQTRMQSKQWIKKPRCTQVTPIRRGLHFFKNKGLVDMRIVPRGLTINASYIVVALGKFIKYLKKKRH